MQEIRLSGGMLSKEVENGQEVSLEATGKGFLLFTPLESPAIYPVG